ncbi:hotdog domain-containing protein [Streptomyces sodiiphilus]|uniref:Hotdog domain-containing protein n=1 Tax=Streptomyces sodiiphilus TaxID=226217 RepID=A0ABN2P2H0_9ACTN
MTTAEQDGTGARPAGALPGRFRTVTTVAWDELDALGVLHHARFVVHAERAFSRLLDAMGYPYDPDPAVRPERHHVVAGLRLDFARPVDRPGPLRVEQRVTALGRTSMTVGFAIGTADGQAVAAEGARTVVRIDRTTRRPLPWGEEFRRRLRDVLTAGPGADGRTPDTHEG